MNVFLIVSGAVLALFIISLFDEITAPRPRVESVLASLVVILAILLIWVTCF